MGVLANEDEEEEEEDNEEEKELEAGSDGPLAAEGV